MHRLQYIPVYIFILLPAFTMGGVVIAETLWCFLLKTWRRVRLINNDDLYSGLPCMERQKGPMLSCHHDKYVQYIGGLDRETSVENLHSMNMNQRGCPGSSYVLIQVNSVAKGIILQIEAW